MKNCYDHKDACKVISSGLQQEINKALGCADITKRATPTRDSILKVLRNNYGWSNKTKVSADANISITARKGMIGLCLQTGNMGRFYADILKLEYLFHKELIEAAVVLIPEQVLAKKWGQNIANFERFTKELKIFSSIIRTPILVYPIPPPA